jgi:hypothetical protein
VEHGRERRVRGACAGSTGTRRSPATAEMSVEVIAPATVLSGVFDQAGLHDVFARVQALGLCWSTCAGPVISLEPHSDDTTGDRPNVCKSVCDLWRV